MCPYVVKNSVIFSKKSAVFFTCSLEKIGPPKTSTGGLDQPSPRQGHIPPWVVGGRVATAAWRASKKSGGRAAARGGKKEAGAGHLVGQVSGKKEARQARQTRLLSVTTLLQ